MSKERNAARERARVLREQAQRTERQRTALLRGGIAAVLVVAVVGITVAVLAGRDSGSDGASSAVAPAGVTDSGGIRLGAAGATVTVQIFEDYQCPYCQQFEAAAGEQLADYAAGTDVAVEYVAVNFLDGQSTDEYSSRAANAAMCVYEQDPDAWPEFHRALYEQQPAEGGAGLPDSTLAAVAQEAGAGDVEGCISDRRHEDWITEETEQAADSGVEQTPTITVNGEALVEPSVAALQAVVEQALRG